MSFLDVYNALYDQVKASSFLTYVDQSQFLKGFRENYALQEYSIIFEPGAEEEDPAEQGSEKLYEHIYTVDIYMRVILAGQLNEATLVGTSDASKKGVLEMTNDVKNAIREDLTLGYSRYGSSVSEENAGGTFALDGTHKYISVSINGKTPTGYDAVLCGDSTLSGAEIASNIQSALRALGQHADDGYYEAVCTFNSSNNQFTIRTDRYGSEQTVEVTAGASDDCSTLLGFDSPTEVSGRNIIQVIFGIAAPNNIHYPVRYRVLPVRIAEEILLP